MEVRGPRESSLDIDVTESERKREEIAYYLEEIVFPL